MYSKMYYASLRHRPNLMQSKNLHGVRGAADRTRTCYPVITNDVLYLLSYSGIGDRRGINVALATR